MIISSEVKIKIIKKEVNYMTKLSVSYIAVESCVINVITKTTSRTAEQN
jgi:hypothetical protein